mmetsp:Transcript_110172/g.351398  ORF Transcript_110172/g.351398 Transcript_110172/m.351398 type:complete len:121 (-) Transcript_110172:101-463(-)
MGIGEAVSTAATDLSTVAEAMDAAVWPTAAAFAAVVHREGFAAAPAARPPACGTRRPVLIPAAAQATAAATVVAPVVPAAGTHAAAAAATTLAAVPLLCHGLRTGINRAAVAAASSGYTS